MAIFPLSVGIRGNSVDGDAELAHHVRISERNGAAFDTPGYALARHRFKVLGGHDSQLALFSACDNRSRQRMLATTLEAGGQA